MNKDNIHYSKWDNNSKNPLQLKVTPCNALPFGELCMRKMDTFSLTNESPIHQGKYETGKGVWKVNVYEGVVTWPCI